MKTADNMVDIEEKDLKKYTKLKEGTKFEVGDLVNVYDSTYAKISKGSKLCKENVNKYNTVLRAK